MQHHLAGLWHKCIGMAECAVEKLSTATTTAIGAVGAVTTLATTTGSPDLEATDAYLHTATLAVGLFVGIGTLGFLGLKSYVVWKHRHTPPSM